jgi:hypothetical protein
MMTVSGALALLVAFRVLRVNRSRRVSVRLFRLAITAVAALLCAGALFVAAAEAANWRVIGHGSSSGDFAVAAASGSVSHPSQIGLSLTGSGVTGLAIVACSKGIASIGSKTTNVSGSGIHVVKLPFKNASSCQVTASGSGSGRVVVKILAR